MNENRSTGARLDRLLLGEARYTREELAELVGLPHDQARALWRALGFADVPDGVRMFTDLDLEALRRVRLLIDSGHIDPRLAVRISRALGYTTARLAIWQGTALVEHLAETGQLGEDAERRGERAYEIAAELIPELEWLLIYAWRRHFAAAATRFVPAAADEEVALFTLAVGFADLVDYTELSRQLNERELAELVDVFEEHAADTIAGAGGRLIKTIGDEVLFVADEPDTAAEIGLRLVEELDALHNLPKLRVGIAYGSVIGRQGDVYGTTVNLASRLTTLAPASTVVIDPAMAEALAGDERYELIPMPQRSVHGFGLVEPLRLRRRHAG
ncbi:adenylate/guanylate cyclase domain-containing protein [Carbonactinospora thermoautotrophica]|uniref:adenylate/guanylate cyclase domain-containing protein n=1 Tax=Carbonactinospora thermoautotrophica TaxID=1469144 RepID=UPI00082A8BF6|nr:adenylate/guanylate cyclase domain-containing protein [Carbonactinospora thermoautotrophica]